MVDCAKATHPDVNNQKRRQREMRVFIGLVNISRTEATQPIAKVFLPGKSKKGAREKGAGEKGAVPFRLDEGVKGVISLGSNLQPSQTRTPVHYGSLITGKLVMPLSLHL